MPTGMAAKSGSMGRRGTRTLMHDRSCVPSPAVRIRRPDMKTYEFSLIASGLDPSAEDFEARFYEHGCDDATISFQKGHIILDFARRAPAMEAAIRSALADVRAAGARIHRVEPDPLVSLADMAARTKMSRAAMTQYSKGQRSRDFPPPV